MATKDIRFDRTVAGELVDALQPAGVLRPLMEFRNASQDVMDLQFRRPSLRVSRVSLYAGLTRILDADVRTVGRDPSFRFFIAHETHRKEAPDFQAWAIWQPPLSLGSHWPEVDGYLSERKQWFEGLEGGHHVIEASTCGHVSRCG